MNILQKLIPGLARRQTLAQAQVSVDRLVYDLPTGYRLVTRENSGITNKTLYLDILDALHTRSQDFSQRWQALSQDIHGKRFWCVTQSDIAKLDALRQEAEESYGHLNQGLWWCKQGINLDNLDLQGMLRAPAQQDTKVISLLAYSARRKVAPQTLKHFRHAKVSF